MNWKSELRRLEQKKDWNSAISFMEKFILDNPNDMNAYIAMNYLLMNLLVEEDHDESRHYYYENLLKHYFKESYAKFSQNAEYLFYTARTAYMSEWYFDMTLEQVREMDFKALSLDPNNILYRWVYIVLLDEKNLYNKTILIDYATIVLDEKSPIKKALESKGAIGEYIFGIMAAISRNCINTLR